MITFKKLSDRGFNILAFNDAYGEECSLQESSSVEPSIWLGIDKNRMHLRQHQVKELLPYLQYFVEHGELPDSRIT